MKRLLFLISVLFILSLICVSLEGCSSKKSLIKEQSESAKIEQSASSSSKDSISVKEESFSTVDTSKFCYVTLKNVVKISKNDTIYDNSVIYKYSNNYKYLDSQKRDSVKVFIRDTIYIEKAEENKLLREERLDKKTGTADTRTWLLWLVAIVAIILMICNYIENKK